MAHRECSMVNIDDSFLNLLFNLRVVRDFHLRGLGRFFYNALENVYGDVNTSTVGQADRWHPHGGEDIESLLLLWSSFLYSICGFVACCMVIILWKGVGRSTGMNNKMWRWALIGGRCLAVLRWCRDESLRCGATRRITSRTGVISGSANLEKTGPFVVKNTNKWPVFRCTVNWARARPRSTLIASGATGSSSV